MRHVLKTHTSILMKLKKMEKKLNTLDDDFKIVFAYLKKVLDPLTEPVRKIGFKQNK